MTAETLDLNLLTDLVTKAGKAGADAADSIFVESASLSASWRMGQNEGIERAEARDLGLRVFVGHAQAVVSSTDTTADALDALVARALAMARTAPEDPYCGLADAERLAGDIPDLDLCDWTEPSSESLLEAASEAEDAARAVAGITNSEGAEASWGRSRIALAASNGFAGAYPASSFGLSASVVAGTDTGMERDYEYSSTRHRNDLDPPAEIGTRAGERTVRRLNARKVASGQVPVVFDPRVSGGFLRLLAGVISGAAIARGTSFLKDGMDKAVFGAGIRVIDDPLRPRGLASRPFDGEGVAPARRAVIDDGRLTTWLLDSRSARQLDLDTTGHAGRGTSAPPMPTPSNLYMEPGAETRDALIGAIDSGLYVTEMMGMSFNNVTGDYSRGAAGFWIEKGVLVYPVSELTVAGNLKDLFPRMTPANDLEFRYGVNAPTLRCDGMTVAGI
ncbi:MAG: TldD/PmbA family protein [Alphaproteobacteria bacterium]|jgi:PmbA protein|nr:TldD/PmbA family protein [Alphaproteobacteria bacterium]MDP6517901.1 TldD/PmbA family protein [Alphaproteobacteria bacterium]